MLNFRLDKEPNTSLRILCLGAHSDDIEIGCGGTILQLIENHRPVEIYWVVFGANEERRTEAYLSAEAFLNAAKTKDIIVKEFRDGYFPYIGGIIKDYFEQLKRDFTPDLIFTHFRYDLHQDHRLLSELTWNTFRSHLILEYEIPKYDGDFGNPNYFVPIIDRICDLKVKYILENFKTQASRQWFTEDTFRSVMRLRGIESGSSSKYAEAFYCRKIVQRTD